MSVISINFYTVKMPDGVEYCAVGKSRKSLAQRLSIEIGDVKCGASSKLKSVCE